MVEVLWIMTRIFEGLNNNDSGYTIMEKSTFSYPFVFCAYDASLFVKMPVFDKACSNLLSFFFSIGVGWVG